MALTIQINRGMYGDCQSITARVDNEYFGGAAFDIYTRGWVISVHNIDGTVTDTVMHVSNDNDGVEDVCVLLRLYYRNNFARRAA